MRYHIVFLLLVLSGAGVLDRGSYKLQLGQHVNLNGITASSSENTHYNGVDVSTTNLNYKL